MREPNHQSRKIRVAAVSGNLDWSLRKRCSNDLFDLDVARRYMAEYVEKNLSRMELAARNADVVVGQEYFRGSELFLAPESAKRELAEPPAGPTARRFAQISGSNRAVLFAAWECVLTSQTGDTSIHETGIITGPEGDLAGVHVKHPRSVPAPSDWDFNTGVRVYDLAPASIGLTVCSDCTYDPKLPLAMSDAGMELLLISGCGFMHQLWEHFLVVRAIDTGCPVAYADDRRAAIVDSDGSFVARTEGEPAVISGEVTLRAPSYLHRRQAR